MRRVIYREGVEDLGIFIHTGAMQWDETLPITWQFGHNITDVIGYAHSIRREDNGEVTARIDLDDNDRGRWAAKVLQHYDAACSIWANHIVEKRKTVGRGKKQHVRRDIHRGRIRQVAVVLTDAVPWK